MCAFFRCYFFFLVCCFALFLVPGLPQLVGGPIEEWRLSGRGLALGTRRKLEPLFRIRSLLFCFLFPPLSLSLCNLFRGDFAVAISLTQSSFPLLLLFFLLLISIA